MADVLETARDSGDPVKFKDQGDGSFAELIAAGAYVLVSGVWLPVSVTNPLPTLGKPGTVSKGYRQGTSTGTQQLLSATISGGLPAGARAVLMRPTAAIRIRDDGTNPTAAIGYPIDADQEWLYDGDSIAALRVINSATIDCWFFA